MPRGPDPLRFASRRIVAAPRSAVFARLTDWDWIEVQAAARGLTLARMSAHPPLWQARAGVNGVPVPVTIRVTEIAAGERLALRADGGGVAFDAVVRLSDAGDGTEMAVDVEGTSSGFRGRLLHAALRAAWPRIAAAAETGLDRIALNVAEPPRER